MFNRSIVVVLVVALAAGLGLLAGRHLFSRAAEAPVPALEAVRLLPAPRAIPAFDLAQADGTRLEPADLAGHWTIVFLGFTHCPDVCPTTLAELAVAQAQWEGLPEARSIPDFQLQQADGTPLERADLLGHWTVVFLGFTHCPDVCPTTLAELALAQKQWESLPAASRPRVLFVSVDPGRDTPEATGRYAHHFHPDTLAATGTIPALEAFATALGMVFMKVPPPDGARADQYSVDHSSTLVLVDPQGRMAGLLRPPLQPDAIAADLLALAAVQ